MNRALLALCLAAACATAAPAMAQNKKVYRCEDASGKVTYSDEACRGGVELKNDDARSPAQREAAAQVVQREERLGDKLARERRVAEKQAAAHGPAHIAHSAANEAARDAPKKPPAKKKSARKGKDEKKAPTQS